jgi:hypothetical protein
MRRLVVLFSAAALSLVGGVITTSAVASGITATTEPSGDTPDATEAHPIVGTWDTETSSGDPGIVMFSADRSVVSLDGEDVSLGVWEASSELGKVNLMFSGLIPAEDGGSGGRFIIRGTLELSPDGQSFTGEYTVEVTADFEGAPPPGEYGPDSVTGTRVVVEPMGTPVGSLDELFGGFEEGTEGTEGTEVTEGTAMAEATEVAAPPTTSP